MPLDIDCVALSENKRFASVVVMFGMLEKNSKLSEKATKNMVLNLAKDAVTFDPHGYRLEFVDLVKKYEGY